MNESLMESCPRLQWHPSCEMVNYKQAQTESKVVTYCYYGSGPKPESLLRTLVIQVLKGIFPHPRLDPQIRIPLNFPQAGPKGEQERGSEKASWHSWWEGCGNRRDICALDTSMLCDPSTIPRYSKFVPWISSSGGSYWFATNAESWTPAQTSWIRIWSLTRSQGDL